MTPQQNSRFKNYRLNGYKRKVHQSESTYQREPVEIHDRMNTGIYIGIKIGVVLFYLFLIYISLMFNMSIHYYNKAADAYRNKEVSKAIRYQVKGEMFRRLVLVF